MQKPSVGIVLTGTAALIAVIALAFRTDAAPELAPPGGASSFILGASSTKTYRIFENDRNAIEGFTGGCRLLAKYLALETDDDGCATQEAIEEYRRTNAPGDSGPIAHILVATLPDPFDSHLDWLYDGNIDAIRRAFAIAGFVPDAFELQDDGDSLAVVTPSLWSPFLSPPGSLKGERRPSLEPSRRYHPGVLLFRRSPKRGARDPLIWLVYTVPELPTTGLNKNVFAAAIFDRDRTLGRLRDTTEMKTLRVMGPTFSGSSISLLSALRARASQLGAVKNICIVTGSATSLDSNLLATDSDRDGKRRTFEDSPVGCNESLLSGGQAVTPVSHAAEGAPNQTGTSISIGSTVHSDATLLLALNGLLRRLDVSTSEVAVLTEAQTSYGSSGGLSRFLTVPFPLNIASLRAEFDRSAEALEEERELPGISAGANTTISPENGRSAKESPPIASRLTVPSVDVMVRDIERTLTLHGTKLVVLIATDVRDKLMLMRALRRRMRDVTFVIFESNVLLLRPEYRRAARGAYILSTYPLVLENEYWQNVSGRANSNSHFLSAFASDVSLGAYNATLTLLGKNSLRRQFAPPGFDPASDLVPPVWITIVGNDAFLPLYATYPTGLHLDYFGNASRYRTEEQFARSLNAKPDKTYCGAPALIPSPAADPHAELKDSVPSDRDTPSNLSCIDSALVAVHLHSNDKLASNTTKARDDSTKAPKDSIAVPEGADADYQLAVLIPFLGLLFVGIVLLAPVRFEKLLPESLRPVGTRTELFYAVLFLGWCVVLLLPVMAQLQLEESIRGTAAGAHFFRTHALVLMLSLTAPFAILAVVAFLLLRPEQPSNVLFYVQLAWYTTQHYRPRSRSTPPVARSKRLRRLLPHLSIASLKRKGAFVHRHATRLAQFLLRILFKKAAVPAAIRWLDSGVTSGTIRAGADADYHERDAESYRNFFVGFLAHAALLLYGIGFGICIFHWSLGVISICKTGCASASIFLYRSSDFFSGGSPTMLLVLMSAMFALWSKWQMDVARDLKRPSDFEVALKDVGRDHQNVSALRSVGHDMWRCRATLLDLIPDESAIWLTTSLFLLVILVWQLSPFGNTLEDVSLRKETAWYFRTVVFMGLIGMLISISWGILRFTAAWQTLQTLLDLFANCRIMKVFGAIPTDVVRAARPALWGEHSFSSPGFGIRRFPLELRDMGNSHIEADVRPRVMRTSKQKALKQIAALRESFDLEPRDSNSAIEELTEIQRVARMVENLGYFDEIGDEVAEQHRRELQCYVPAEVQVDLATYFALEIGFFVARIMFVLRRLAVVLVLSLLLAVMLTAVYPFHSQSLLRWGVTGLMVFALASLLTVIARMSTNSVLRQVTQTEEGSSLGATAVFNLLVFAVIPLMGFLATDIPVVRSFLVSWVEPLTRALTK